MNCSSYLNICWFYRCIQDIWFNLFNARFRINCTKPTYRRCWVLSYPDFMKRAPLHQSPLFEPKLYIWWFLLMFNLYIQFAVAKLWFERLALESLTWIDAQRCKILNGIEFMYNLTGCFRQLQLIYSLVEIETCWVESC